ncbi:hypothetical protein QL285_044027 [Trifolium repens]|nr:hypothetical protein QL285_044027 [Trifolium repens]
MCLAWVYGDHFMGIHLKPGSPIPLTSVMWDGHCCENASKWSDRYIARMSDYGDLKRVHGGHIVEYHDTRPKIVHVFDLDTKDSIVSVNLGED